MKVIKSRVSERLRNEVMAMVWDGMVWNEIRNRVRVGVWNEVRDGVMFGVRDGVRFGVKEYLEENA